jgi:hypothetical protein
MEKDAGPRAAWSVDQHKETSTMHRIRCFTCTALVVVATSLPAAAAGLLGERWLDVSCSHLFTETARYDNGWGAALVYNQPLSDRVDLGGTYQYAAFDAASGRPEVGDFSDQRLYLHATGHMASERERIWVRVGAGAGRVEHGGSTRTGLAWLVTVGTEYPLGAKRVLTPYAGWSDVLDDGETTDFVYGALLVFDVSDTMGIGVRLEGDHHYNFALSLGVVGRF